MPQALPIILPAAMTGFGLINNYLQQRRMNQLRQQAQDPRYIEKFLRPIQAGETASVENAAQARMGESGIDPRTPLGAAIYSQALAPLYQQQQSLAASEAGKSLDVASGLLGQPTNLAPSLQALMASLQKQPVPSIPDASGLPASGRTGNWGDVIGLPGVSDIIPPPPDVSGLPATTQIPDWSGILGSVSAPESAFSPVTAFAPFTDPTAGTAFQWSF